MSVKIEKGKPIPDDLRIHSQHTRGSRLKYPWDTMDIGDSFAIPDDVKAVSISASASKYGRLHGKKFSVSKKERRVWRIE